MNRISESKTLSTPDRQICLAGFSPSSQITTRTGPRPWQRLSDRRQSNLLRPWRARTDDLPVVLQLFFSGLARRPYSWDGEAIHIRPRLQAIDATNIQHGLPGSSRWLALDIDRPYEPELIEPAPHVVLQNRENGHAHLLFRLRYPSRYDNTWCRQLRRQLDHRYGADSAFSGRIVKNPLRPDAWDIWTRNGPAWTFRGLSERLDPLPIGQQLDLWPGISDAPGRNCFVFEVTRVQAYQHVRRCTSGDELLDWCLDRVQQVPISPALGYPELKHIAKSISRWTWSRFCPGQFSAVQADRGHKGGIQSGQVRRAGSLSELKPWEKEGISRRTWYRRRDRQRGPSQ